MTILETSFNQTPIDLASVRDAARRAQAAQGARATDDLAAAILERLAAEEPLTPPLLFFAVRSGDSPLSPSAKRRIRLPLAATVEATFQTEIDEFCRKFFDLDPDARRARWTELRRRTSASPALTARLEELSRGLEVDCSPLSDQKPAVQRAASLVREFFVLPPRERAVKRREWLAAQAVEAKSLRSAAWRLARLFPMTANLDPVFLERLRRPARRRPSGTRVRISSQLTRQEHPFDRFMRKHPWAHVLFFGGWFGMVLAAALALTSQSQGPRYKGIQPLSPIHYHVPVSLLPAFPDAKKPAQEKGKDARLTPKKSGSGL